MRIQALATLVAALGAPVAADVPEAVVGQALPGFANFAGATAALASSAQSIARPRHCAPPFKRRSTP